MNTRAESVLTPGSYETFLWDLKNQIGGSKHLPIKLDLSQVKFFDIGCVLHLISVLYTLRALEKDFILVLPDGVDEKFQKSRDFLKRWRFFDAVKENVGDPMSLIPPVQRSYLLEEQKYYRKGQMIEAPKIVHEILSKEVVEICSFTRQEGNVQRVSEPAIEDYMARFIEERDLAQNIARALGLSSNVGLAVHFNQPERPSYEIFYKTFVYEALINTKYHPNATISLAALSSTPRHTHLVIAIVDNGESIPKTISRLYSRHRRKERKNGTLDLFPSKTIGMEFNQGMSQVARIDAEKILYACHPGVTSRKSRSPNLGMGLTYLVRDTLRLNGEISIRSGHSSVRFSRSKDSKKSRCNAIEVSKWRGTLIRIQVPVLKTKVK